MIVPGENIEDYSKMDFDKLTLKARRYDFVATKELNDRYENNLIKKSLNNDFESIRDLICFYNIGNFYNNGKYTDKLNTLLNKLCKEDILYKILRR